MTVPAAGAAATGTATASAGIIATNPPSDTALPAIPSSDTAAITTATPAFVNDQPPDLLTNMDYFATTGNMFGYGVPDGSTMGLPSGVFDPYTPIPFQMTPSNPLDQTAFDLGSAAGPSTVIARESATVRGRKRVHPHDTTREAGKGSSRKQRKGSINSQLAANQETATQAPFTAIPRPEGMPNVEYGMLSTAQGSPQVGGTRTST